MTNPANPLSEAAHADMAARRAVDAGGPAFPATVSRTDGPAQVGSDTFMVPGMSLRDYFAAKAMQALIRSEVDYTSEGSPRLLAAEAGVIADAMLAERAKAAR